MIVSHSKRFVFFRVPRTGSTTAQVMLRLSGAFDLETDLLTPTEQWLLPGHNIPFGPLGHQIDPHITPQVAVDEGILTKQQLLDYDCYAFCRNAQSTVFQRGVLGRKQVDWFFLDGQQVVHPLDFANFEAELRGLILFLGGHNFDEIPRMNVAGFGGHIADIRHEVEYIDAHEEDREFYQDNFGGAIA